MLPVYKNMFNFANGLNKGFHLLYDNYGRDGDYIHPSILCSTFCLELLLKCLQLIKIEDAYTRDDLKRKNINVDAHKYSEIFGKIDDDIKEEIISTYNQKYGERIKIEEFKEKLILVGDKNFVDWRYIYEKGENKELNLILQFKLLDSLGETICRLLKQKSGT